MMPAKAPRDCLDLNVQKKDNTPMPFLYALLGSLIALLAEAAFLWVRSKMQKTPIESIRFFLPALIDAGFGAGVCLLIALVVTIFTGGIGALNGILFSALLSLLVLVSRPHRFLGKKEERQKPTIRSLVCLSLLTLGMAVELIGFNSRAFSSYGPIETMPVSSFVSTNATIENDEIILQNGQYFIVEGKEGATSLRFNFVPTDNVSITVKVDQHNGIRYTEFAKYEMDGKNVDYHIVRVPAGAQLRFTFTFDDHYLQQNSIRLQSVTFGAKPQAFLSVMRFGLFTGLVFLFAYAPEVTEHFKKRREAGKLPYLIIGGFAIASVAVASIAMLINKDGFFVSYPLATEALESSETDIFVALFDAFRKGQPNLDVTVDPKLLALENPYDPAARSAAGASYLWDHAFYNGKYYCYYGAMPVLLVSFPLYLLSGMSYVPNAFALEVVGMAALIPAFLLLLLEIVRFTRKKISWSSYVLLGFAGIFTSMMIMAITFKDGYYHEAIYHVPDIYGLLFFDLFLFFVLRAYRKVRWRTLELALSGLCFVFVIASRPNLVFGVIIAVPFYLSMLFRNEVPWKKKLSQFGALAGVLLVGGVLICVYNKVRFDSILEFGQSYQLNVTDQRTLTYSLDKFYPSFLHFFLQEPKYYNTFPFLSASVERYGFDNCPYVSGYAGTLRVPLFALVFLMPFVFWNKGHEKRAFSFLFPILLVAFAYTTYSKAGICARYLIEQYHLATIGAFFFLLQLFDDTEQTKAYTPIVLLSTFVVAYSAFLCLNLSFDGFDGMNKGDMNGFFLLWKEVFRSYNL